MTSKKTFTFLVFLLAFTTSRAQFALIPDTNFRNFLQANGFSACIQGNSLDTTCPAVLAATKINATSGSIRSISGIEYFKNLDTLICGSGWYLDSIADIPDSLIYFSCTNFNHLTELPDLPSTLLYLNCLNDSLTFLPTLPAGLQILYCQLNYFPTLPVLPSGLLELVCSSNSLTSLPALPATLNRLHCSANQLTTLPLLPAGLDTIDCSGNINIQLPTLLPDSLEYLSCGSDSLYTLPPLPSALRYLLCSDNNITSLPTLPPALSYLDCSNNELTSLPVLPTDLGSLYCGFNNLNSLPALPLHLGVLYCQNNNLTELPSLPDPYYFVKLDCSYNNLNGGGNYDLTISSDGFLFYLNCSNNPSLDVINIQQPYPEFTYLNCSNCMLWYLPNNLYFNANGGGQLICDHNYLTNISIPNYVSLASFSHNQIYSIAQSQFYGLNELHCDSNLLTTLPVLPETLSVLKIQSNPIECLPELQTITSFYWDNTDIHCLPNYGHITNAFPPLSTIGLCQPSDNCPSMWNIIGDVFFDADSNCTQNLSEISLKDIPVVLDSGGIELQRYLTDTLGRYSFRTGYGTYTIRVDTASAPYRVVCPPGFLITSALSAIDSLDTVPSFGLLCNNAFDLTARSITPTTMFRPGFQTTLHLDAGDGMDFSGISCATNISGSVQAILSGLATYISPAGGALTPSNISGDTITWNISDFSTVNPTLDFNIIVEVSTAATLNDSICIQLDVFPVAGDHLPANNHLSDCFPVRGAVDPNEKYMSPSGLVDSTMEWFTFTVFFQNVGNAPAENIYIIDTLSANLDATTFTWISSSHDLITQLLPGNILRFNFPGIHLLDSVANEPASHGYVKFKVKKMENLPAETVISNVADIFFDYNAPVTTNVVSATLHVCPPVVAGFVSTDSLCPGACTSFNNNSGGNVTYYQWYFPGAVPDASTDPNPANVCYPQGGYFPVTLIVGCLNQRDTLTIDTFMTVLPGANFTTSDQAICPGSCIDFTDLSLEANAWFWNFPGANTLTSSQQNPVNICYQNSGTYSVDLLVIYNGCIDSLSLNDYITVFSPVTVIIQQSDDSLFATAGFGSYQWYQDSVPIAGATNTLYVATQNGIYSVVAVDSNGCESFAILSVMVGTNEETIEGVSVFPNPARSQMTVDSKSAEGRIRPGGQYTISSIEIVGTMGQKVYSLKAVERKKQVIDVTNFPTGVYFIKIILDDGSSIVPLLRKFIKQ